MSTPYPAFFLDFADSTHQLSSLVQLVDWRDGVSMDDDGCLIFQGEAPVVDGWEADPTDARVLFPTAPECADRIHALLIESGTPRLEAYCMNTACGHFKAIVAMKDCEACPLKRGRV